MKWFLLFLISLNSYALTIFKCGDYLLPGSLNGIDTSYTLTIHKDTMSEVEIPVTLSSTAIKMIESISARPINAHFEISLLDGGTRPVKATIQKIVFTDNPLLNEFKLLNEKKCPANIK